MKKKQDLNKYLPRKPFKINKFTWFYLDPKGIDLIYEVRGPAPTFTFNRTDHIFIPWKKIEDAYCAWGNALRKQSKS